MTGRAAAMFVMKMLGIFISEGFVEKRKALEISRE
jgi:hypothetical protein